MFDGARILLAEEDMIEQLNISQPLEELGALVTIARTGFEAVELIGSDIFELVLIDLQIHKMDGYETINKIRALHQGKEIPRYSHDRSRNGE